MSLIIPSFHLLCQDTDTIKAAFILTTSKYSTMDRWTNKVALVTGAGSGIGAQICRELCSHGLIVYGLDCNEESLQSLFEELHGDIDSVAFFSTVLCDLTDEDQIVAAFDRITSESGGVDILVNCAGMMTNNAILEDEGDERLQRMFQLNVLAVISCIKKAYKSMADRDADGHIVNMCSVTGHGVPGFPGLKPVASAYYASKFAVNALNRVINQELIYFNKPKIRITNISPGLVGGTNIAKDTDFEEALRSESLLQPKDISDTLRFILSAPRHVQVREVILESVGGMMY